MAILGQSDREKIRPRLAALERPVALLHFTQELECPSCSVTRRLLQELVSLSDRLRLETHDFLSERELATRYGVDKVPATVLLADGKDRGIRFYGAPAGYEFNALLEDLSMVARGDSGLAAETRVKLAELDRPVHIEVFVTSTCPYCPKAVHLAHQFAMESEKIAADMVEATEYPHLVRRHRVMGVPKTIVNGRDAVEGLVPEAVLLETVLRILQEEAAHESR